MSRSWRASLLFRALPDISEVERLDLASCPWGPSQELEAGPDTRVIRETSDMNHPPHRFPAVMCYQSRENHLQRDSVKGIIGSFVRHFSVPLFRALNGDTFAADGHTG